MSEFSDRVVSPRTFDQGYFPDFFYSSGNSDNYLGVIGLIDEKYLPNHNDLCGFGINNACASPDTNYLTFGIGQATMGTRTSCFNLFNSAVDSTVITHEFGHIVNHHNYGGTIRGNINFGYLDKKCRYDIILNLEDVCLSPP